MKLVEQIDQELIEAQKAKEERLILVLRGIKSEIKNKEIDLKHELSDKEVTSVIQSEVKKRKDAIAQFDADKHSDLIKNEEAEQEILKKYLPKQLSDNEVGRLIDEAVKETGATSISQMGQVMSALMPKLGGRADGTKVAELVKSKLGQ